MSSRISKIKVSEVIAIGLVALTIGHFTINALNKRAVLANPEFVFGRIVDYTILFNNNRSYLTYEYEVDGTLYSRYVVSYGGLDYCEKNLEECRRTKLFWVVYDKEAPKRSLIDLTVEINRSGLESKPENFDNFK